MKDNRGISLVEVLVTIVIAAIVISGISTMIIVSIKVYGKTGATVDLQNEAQTTLAFLADTTMEATGLTLVQTDLVQTGYVLLGKFEKISSTEYEYSGNVIVNKENTAKGYREIYLSYYEEGELDPIKGALQKGTDKSVIAAQLVGDIIANKESYLLTQNVKRCFFDIAQKDSVTTDGKAKFDYVNSKYSAPLSIEIILEFEKQNGADTVTREVSDVVKVRSRCREITLVNVKDPSGLVDMSGIYQLKK